jgi:alpha-beta hydrolase superfamily lysophospholipase
MPEIDRYFSILQEFRNTFHPHESQAPEPTAYYIQAHDGISIYFHEFIPKNPKAIVICQHGNTCQADLYYPLADHLFPHGIGVVAVDNRGHGRSGPQRGDLDNPFLIFPIYDFLIERYSPIPCHFLGESLGAAMIAAYFSSKSNWAQKLRSIIFLVPPYRLRIQPLLQIVIWPLRGLLKMGQLFSLGRPFFPFKPDFRPTYYRGYHRIDQGDLIRSPKTTARHFLSLLRLIPAFPMFCRSLNKPLLAMIGTNDQMLDPQGVKQMILSLPFIKRKMVVFQGSDHSLLFDKNSQKSYQIITNWLLSNNNKMAD